VFWTKNKLKITIINCTSQIEYQIKSFPIKGPKGTYVDDMSILTFHVSKKAMCQVVRGIILPLFLLFSNWVLELFSRCGIFIFIVFFTEHRLSIYVRNLSIMISDCWFNVTFNDIYSMD
jgi:hypothetical protein